MLKFCNALLTDSGFSDNGYSISRMRAFRMNTMNPEIWYPVLKLERRKLIAVTMNMTVVARVEKPLRL